MNFLFFALAGLLAFMGGQGITVAPRRRKPSQPPRVVRTDAGPAEAAQVAAHAEAAVRKARESEPEAGPKYGPRANASTSSPPASARAARVDVIPSAQQIADHLRAKGYNYDRKLLKRWQATRASLKADGLYGPKTRAALIAAGAKNVPKADFK